MAKRSFPLKEAKNWFLTPAVTKWWRFSVFFLYLSCSFSYNWESLCSVARVVKEWILAPVFEGAANFRRNDNHQLRYNRTPGPAVNNTDDILLSLSVLLLSGKGLGRSLWFFCASMPNGLGCRNRLIWRRLECVGWQGYALSFFYSA